MMSLSVTKPLPCSTTHQQNVSAALAGVYELEQAALPAQALRTRHDTSPGTWGVAGNPGWVAAAPLTQLSPAYAPWPAPSTTKMGASGVIDQMASMAPRYRSVKPEGCTTEATGDSQQVKDRPANFVPVHSQMRRRCWGCWPMRQAALLPGVTPHVQLHKENNTSYGLNMLCSMRCQPGLRLCI
jgi:hypothetical protein